jgi:YidC/Oxa1 family membrane protein insertase
MDRRHLVFLVVSAIFLFTYLTLHQIFFPPKEVVKPEDDPNAVKPPAVVQELGDPEAGPVSLAESHPQTFHTLGSLDPDSGYRMLVTLNSSGATIERAELNRFRELNDLARYNEDARPMGRLGGYLGHLRLKNVAGGVEVQVVGAGTPAEQGGLRVGDVIQSVNGVKVEKDFQVTNTLRLQTRAGEEINLTVLRNGRPETITVTLADTPLQIIQPSTRDPRSMRLTLGAYATAGTPEADEAFVDPSTTPPDAPELGSLDLFKSNWRFEPGDDPQREARYVAELPGLGLRLVKTYRLSKVGEDPLKDPGYDLSFNIRVENTTDRSLVAAYRLLGPSSLPTEGAWYVYKIGGLGMRDVVLGPVEGSPTLITTQELMSEEPQKALGQGFPLAYFGVETPYFAGILIPRRPAAEPGVKPREVVDWVRAVRYGDPPRDIPKFVNSSVEVMGALRTLPAGASYEDQYTLFLGPKAPDRVLSAYGLTGIMNYGWFPFLVKPLIWYLDTLYTFVGNFGIAIILLTITVRLLLLPLSLKQTINMQRQQTRMAKIQPEIEKLKERYKNDRQKLAVAQQELMLKNGVNPLAMAGGCLIMFLQLPIFVGLFNALRIDIELRDAPLFPGVPWAENLAAPDMLFFWAPYLPDFIAGPTGYLGPYFNLLPILATGLLYFQQKLLMPKATNPEQAMQQKMFGFMTLFFGLFFFTFPSGLSLYFIVSTLWGLTERLVIMPKFVKKDEDEPIEVKPIKSSTLSPDDNGNKPGGVLKGLFGEKEKPAEDFSEKAKLRKKRSRDKP